MMATTGFVAVDDECAYFSVLGGDDLPSQHDGGFPGTGISQRSQPCIVSP